MGDTMMIVKHPNKVLSTSCQKVDSMSDAQPTVLRLLAEAKKHKNCAGLAGPQIDISESVAIVRKSKTDWQVLVNPDIVAVNGEKQEDEERCKSLDDAYNVWRYSSITVECLNGTFEFEGMLARVVAHEIDHLHGVLICDIGQPISDIEKSKMTIVVEEKINRNSICPLCNSGKKYKKCCGR